MEKIMLRLMAELNKVKSHLHDGDSNAGGVGAGIGYGDTFEVIS
jgi:hypothetical protein